MIRGEIWTIAGSGYASKPRPALIVQDDAFDATASIVVLLFTSTHIDADFARVRIAATELSGLDHSSDIMIDKIASVPRERLGTRIGRVSTAQLAEVERALLVFLGLAR